MTRLIIKPIEATVGNAGPKAAVLAQASAIGLPVLPFVVVTADAYRQHAARAGVRVTQPGEAATAIRSTALAFDLGMALTAALRRLGPHVAVRPSAVGEDLPAALVAGLRDATLGVDADTVDDAVLECWSSLWSGPAIAYREQAGVSHGRAAMAVILQRMVAPTLAGVAHTADRTSGRPDIVVEWSLEAAAPERAVFTRREIVHEVSDAAPPFDPDNIPRSVAHLALAAEDLIERPVDVEWAFADGALWLLQVQPLAEGLELVVPAPSHRPVVQDEAQVPETGPDGSPTMLPGSGAREPVSGEAAHAQGLLGRLIGRLRGQ